MRYLALDVGDERIGVAMSDDRGILVRPLEVIARRAGSGSYMRLRELVSTHHVGTIVVGLPLLSDGSEGRQVRSTRAYIAGLQVHLTLPIVLWDERMTTARAQEILTESGAHMHRRRIAVRKPGHKKGSARADDAIAAAVILQEYLDAQRERSDERGAEHTGGATS